MPVRRGRLDQLLQFWEPRVRRAFLEAFGTIRSEVRLNSIIRMLEEENIEGAIRAVGLNPAVFRPLDVAIGRAFEASGNMAVAGVSSATAEGLRTVFRFDMRNPVAEAWLQNWAGTKITEIINDQRNAIRDTLTDALAKGLNPRTAALDLVGRIAPNGARQGGIIGLTSTQAEWVRNYTNDLQSDNPLIALTRKLRDKRFDGTVRGYAERNEPIPADLIEKMVIKYSNRALLLRAEAIARTETLHALHEAQQQAIEQALEAGAVDPRAIGLVWHTVRDNRVRDAHEFMEGQRVAWGEMFVDGEGNELAYPGDPRAPPETTINCLLGDSEVVAGKVRRAYRRWYEGDLFKVHFDSGRCLSGTSNHPVLTARGLIGLGFLQEGDYVISSSFGEQSSAVGNNQNVPTSIKEIFETFSVTGFGERWSMSPADFHGDGTYGNVDIVSTTRDLMLGGESSIMEPIKHLHFALAEEVAGSDSSFSPSRHISERSLLTSYSSMRFGDLFGSLSFGELGPLQKFGFGSSSQRHPVLSKNGMDNPSTNIELLCDLARNYSSFVKHDDVLCNLTTYLSTLLGPTEGFRAGLRRVKSIDCASFSGHVYNLETESGIYYANNILVGNCRCWREPDIDFLYGIE